MGGWLKKAQEDVKSELHCPKCGKEIDSLMNMQRMMHANTMTVDSEGYADYEEEKSWDEGVSEFECPECEEVLFINEEDAINFLTRGAGSERTVDDSEEGE